MSNKTHRLWFGYHKATKLYRYLYRKYKKRTINKQRYGDQLSYYVTISDKAERFQRRRHSCIPEIRSSRIRQKSICLLYLKFQNTSGILSSSLEIWYCALGDMTYLTFCWDTARLPRLLNAVNARMLIVDGKQDSITTMLASTVRNFNTSLSTKFLWHFISLLWAN